jgi:hypothetical protein
MVERQLADLIAAEQVPAPPVPAPPAGVIAPTEQPVAATARAAEE